MAYLHDQDALTLGWVGCGPSCSCVTGQRNISSGQGLGELYVEEEEDEQPSPRVAPPRTARPPLPPRPTLSGWRGLGEQPPLRRGPSLQVDLQLRMPPFETIVGFVRGSATLNTAQIQRINRVAEVIARSWTGPSRITSVRVTGYLDSQEWQPDLGQLRSNAVRNALVAALSRLNPGLAPRLRWLTEDRGFSPVAKVEIYLWVGPTAMPVPPMVRLPSPAEAARTVVPLGPETPPERIQRILRTLPPPPPRRRSLSQMFWQRVDGSLHSAMSRVGVPASLRGPIRSGVHAAIERGAEAVLDRVLGAAELSSEAREAIKASVRAFLQVPIE
jgi:outer membrane protein OmpA-like peptidoglycan-associated protein